MCSEQNRGSKGFARLKVVIQQRFVKAERVNHSQWVTGADSPAVRTLRTAGAESRAVND
jgi:hypothetical protein